MESLKSYHNLLKEFSEQAAKLVSATRPLTALFEAERDQLARIDEVYRLQELLQNIRNQLEKLRRSERAAENADTNLQNTKFLAEIVFMSGKALVTRSLSKGFKSGLFPLNSNRKEPTFGELMIVVGPSGQSQDVKAVSISKLSRDSNKTEAEVIAELRSERCLLLNEEGFNSVIERLISGIQDGTIRPPIFEETDSQTNGLKEIE